MAAASGGHNDVVAALLARPDCDVNFSGRGGDTALINAAGSGRTRVVRTLLSVAELEINTQDDGGFSALIAATQGNHYHVVNVKVCYPGIYIYC